MLSIIIPSYKDPLLHKTIDSLLTNSEGEIEIIPVLDGYWPSQEIKTDERIKVLHLGGNRGMRRAINAGIAISRGEFIMRTDEHCAFGAGYDTILTRDCQKNWIITPRRYFLDPAKWKVMDVPPVDFMKLKIVNVAPGVRKFSGVDAPGDDKQPIQETMAMQGSCWMMPRAWWDKVIGELQNEGYGPHYQDSHEMVFKTWKAGGKLMVDKNTWHAHKHRDFPRTHNNGTPENPSNNEACWAYSLSVWEDYFNKEIIPKWETKSQVKDIGGLTNLVKAKETENNYDQKSLWEKLAKKSSKYFICTNYGTKITEKQFNESGFIDYQKYILDDPLVRPAETFLEIGCGVGRILNYVTNDTLFKNIVGIDISNEMIQQARKRLSDKANLKLIETDGNKIPLDNDSVDLAFSHLVFVHFKTDKMMKNNFNEVFRILKRKGLFKVLVRTNKANLDKWWGGITFDDKVALDAGFKIIKKEPYEDWALWLWLEKR